VGGLSDNGGGEAGEATPTHRGGVVGGGGGVEGCVTPGSVLLRGGMPVGHDAQQRRGLWGLNGIKAKKGRIAGGKGNQEEGIRGVPQKKKRVD